MRKIRRRKKNIESETRLIFDGNALGYAAFHAYGDLEDDLGNPTAVIFGFIRLILAIQEKLNGDEWIFCWDSRKSFRKDIYPQYKASREENKTEDELAKRRSAHEQFTKLRKEVIPALGFANNFISPGYEGDDLMAAILDDVDPYKNILCTSDNDMFQCLDDCDIYHLATKKMFTRNDFMKKFKIWPEQWAEAKAIGGCNGDGVFGIEGVADPKKNTSKALKYLNDDLNKGIILNRIESTEGQEIIRRNLRLVKLPFEGKTPIKFKLGPNELSKEKFEEVFEKYRFISLLEKKMFQRYIKAFKIKDGGENGRTIRRRKK